MRVESKQKCHFCVSIGIPESFAEAVTQRDPTSYVFPPCVPPGPRGQVKGGAVAQRGQSCKAAEFIATGSTPHRTAATTLNQHPPSSCRSDLHWHPLTWKISGESETPGTALAPLLRLQTAEILSQLQDYYLVLRAGECCGCVFMPARPPCRRRED